jgi:hypothetical protein
MYSLAFICLPSHLHWKRKSCKNIGHARDRTWILPHHPLGEGPDWLLRGFFNWVSLSSLSRSELQCPELPGF